KRLRPALALLTAGAGGILTTGDGTTHSLTNGHGAAEERVLALAAAVEMLHTATLVHDDVIDGALLRRGAPTLNATWSGGATVLAGNYMFGTAALFSAQTEDLRVIHLFSDTLEVIVTGELNQLRARYQFEQSKAIYYQRIYAKTASLFCAATKGAALLAGLSDEAVEAMRQYGYHLGMAFQIIDDVLDFTSDESTLGKPAGSDLLGGTLTLPFFYYAQQQRDPAVYLAYLATLHQQAEDDDEPERWSAEIRKIVDGVRKSDAIAHSYVEAEHFLAKAHENLACLPPSPYRDSLHGLCDFVVQRRY
ncbi:MAG: polyprenyl synthetase family protein, partial [Caldilineaceae bacterium]|nr:polyprenyl synthetase family protein [Caldilineaceae bacterium]